MAVRRAFPPPFVWVVGVKAKSAHFYFALTFTGSQHDNSHSEELLVIAHPFALGGVSPLQN